MIATFNSFKTVLSVYLVLNQTCLLFKVFCDRVCSPVCILVYVILTNVYYFLMRIPMEYGISEYGISVRTGILSTLNLA